MINRAPVLTLWAAMAGLNTYSKGVALGFFNRHPRPSESNVKSCEEVKGYGLTTAPAGLTFKPGLRVSEDPFVIFNPLCSPAISFGTRPASGSPQQHISDLDP